MTVQHHVKFLDLLEKARGIVDSLTITCPCHRWTAKIHRKTVEIQFFDATNRVHRSTTVDFKTPVDVESANVLTSVLDILTKLRP